MMKTGIINDLWRVLTLLLGFLFGMYVAVFLHECGHALGALLHGDRVYAVVMQIPAPAGYVQASSQSWMLTCGGVVFGTLFSLAPLLLVRCFPAKSAARFAALMVTALALAHNGLYLSVGGIAPFADAAGMVALGVPRLLLFVCGVPLLAGFVVVMSRAIAMVGCHPSDSLWKWIAVVELGLLPLPALALVATLVAPGQQHGATVLPMFLWSATYAAGFAVAALRVRTTERDRKTDTESARLPQRWTVTLALLGCTALVILLEWRFCRPV